MTRIKLISGEFCSRCHLISPLLKKYAESNWYEFEEKDIKLATPEEIWDSTMLPIIWFGDIKKEYDEVLNIIS